MLQAGPLEKVAIPSNKNMAFITYKHSVSAPYAKELFCDTKLHGSMLNINFRTGSVHASGGRRPPRQDHQNGGRDMRSINSSGGGGYSNHSYQSQQNVGSHSNYSTPTQQNGAGLFSPPIPGNYPGTITVQGMPPSPFAMNPQSMPPVAIQGYRSTVDNREYVPEYVSFNNPPVNFRGAIPVNHPDHAVGIDERRRRLLNQQRYVTQNDMHRSHGRYAGHRR